ncbi:class II aldolase [Alsobacter metallidurans]|uniref:3-oxo-tetronate 4-phosphate decarboxylase n=1 Tax=Alsobacter metallidurans TaxID=340221 RepID=A0A917I4P8_9HYPH|nr:aldolase [Alsobacter metallidurans]GGH14157.1 class II aldolase [Alsobacter metallidurans]
MSDESRLREEICRVGASLFARGYTVGAAGNISARLSDGFLITPTDACLGFLDPARLSKLDRNGEQISGDRASKTIRLHRAIYEADQALGGVVHTHSTHLVALSLTPGVDSRNMLPPLTPYHVMKAGRVPLIPYRRPGAPEVVDLVTPHVPHCRGVMLARVGPTFWHENVSAASAALEEAEETAKLVILTRGACLPPLGERDIDDLREAFAARW